MSLNVIKNGAMFSKQFIWGKTETEKELKFCLEKNFLPKSVKYLGIYIHMHLDWLAHTNK